MMKLRGRAIRRVCLSSLSALIIFMFSSLATASESERDFIDPVGFSTKKEQIQAVVESSRQYPERSMKEQDLPGGPMLAAICPHDDHIYAGPLYLPVMERIRAKHLILIGVFHKARKWNVEDALVFDDFRTWKGPIGPVPVDLPFRSAVLKELPQRDFVVSNEYHQEEHSLEAFIAFIQYFNPEAEILPILVPYMIWERMDQLAHDLAGAVSKVMKDESWKWGEEVQVIISNDSVHYGDQGWGGKNYAPFGTGLPGLMKAKAQDQNLIKKHLLGNIDQEKLKRFLYRLVDEKNVREYKIPWCGRFAIPFGLDFIYYLSQDLSQDRSQGLTRNPTQNISQSLSQCLTQNVTQNISQSLSQNSISPYHVSQDRFSRSDHHPVPRGWLLGYGTSVEMGELPVRDLGLGVTAPANLHHWVAYASVGFFNP